MLQPGHRLGDRYRLEARIGAGGMGEVWRAVDEVLDRVVAVKAMLPEVADEATFAKRFLVEAKAMASVNHPAVASIHDYGRSGEITYLVMEFIEGESLSQLLTRSGRLSADETMRLVAQAADGLQAVHERGIVHRDIKPANVMIRRNGSLLITDFGISRTEDGTHLTVSGAILGTPTYISPEQVLGQPATARSDVYSLGLTAYECLAGHRPFTGDNPYAIALQRVQSAPRTLKGDFSGPVLAVIERALAVDPADRWPSATAMADAARAAVEGRPVAAPAPAPRARRSRRPWFVAAAMAVLLAAGVAVWQMNDKDSDRQSSGTPTADSFLARAGFAPCGAAFCPTAPLCWGGVTSISGRALPPGRYDCAESHAWEVFAAIELPADAAEVRQDALMARTDIGAACSATVMAARSRDGVTTEGWERDAWPVQIVGTDRWVLHCIAGPSGTRTATSAFTGA